MDRKTELIEAAKDVMFEKGYTRTKISDIVAKAGVAQGTFYLYFKSKEELLVEISRLIVDDLKKRLSSIENVGDKLTKEEFVGKISNLVAAFTDFMRSNSKAIRICANETSNNDELAAMKNEMVDRSLGILVSFLEQGRKSGIVKSFDYKVMARLLIFAILQFFTSSESTNMEFPTDDMIKTFIEVCLYGILK